jgi:glycosyltransferase involved in cell wall biosynthesis
MKKLKKAGIHTDVEIIADFSKESLSEFFSKVTVLTVPVLKGEAFGTYQLESLACGTPLVQPALGAFPEIIEKTRGGAFYSPNTAEAMVSKWIEVLSNPDKILEMSKKGRESILSHYTNEVLTKKVLNVYEDVIRLNLK